MSLTRRILLTALAVATLFPNAALRAQVQGSTPSNISTPRSANVQADCDLLVKDWLSIRDSNRKDDIFKTVANFLADHATSSKDPAFSEELRAWLLKGAGRKDFEKHIENEASLKDSSMLTVMFSQARAYKAELDKVHKSAELPSVF